MCEVTKNNFEAIFPALERNINNAAFIALDLEFTGLTSDDAHRPSLFDTGADRYRKLKMAVSQFSVPQIGLSAFVPDPDDLKKHVAYSYNFYLFPASYGPIDVRFMCQSSCLKFLSTHNFDFNKFIYDGVSFLNEEQEMVLEKYLSELHGVKDLNRKTDVCSEVASWSVVAKEGDVLKLQASNDLSDLILISELKQSFSNIWASHEHGEISVRKISSAKREQLESESFQEDKNKILSHMLGFTRVFRTLIKSHKPIVGHNCFTDLLLLYDKFYKPLPDKYSVYKSDICALFPRVFDTKYMTFSAKNIFEERGLPHKAELPNLFNTLSSKKAVLSVLCSPSVSHGEGCEQYAEKSYPHEAGYDAFMCGFVFLKMAHLIATVDKKPSEIEPLSFSEYLVALQPYANYVNVIRAAVGHVRLDEADPQSDRPDMLCVKTRSPAENLDLKELAQQFNKYGSVDIRLINSKQAVIAVNSHRSSRNILRAFHGHPSLLVVRYKAWKHSSFVRALMWCGVFVFGSLSAWTLCSGLRTA